MSRGRRHAKPNKFRNQGQQQRNTQVQATHALVTRQAPLGIADEQQAGLVDMGKEPRASQVQQPAEAIKEAILPASQPGAMMLLLSHQDWQYQDTGAFTHYTRTLPNEGYQAPITVIDLTWQPGPPLDHNAKWYYIATNQGHVVEDSMKPPRAEWSHGCVVITIEAPPAAGLKARSLLTAALLEEEEEAEEARAREALQRAQQRDSVSSRVRPTMMPMGVSPHFSQPPASTGFVGLGLGMRRGMGMMGQQGMGHTAAGGAASVGSSERKPSWAAAIMKQALNKVLSAVGRKQQGSPASGGHSGGHSPVSVGAVSTTTTTTSAGRVISSMASSSLEGVSSPQGGGSSEGASSVRGVSIPQKGRGNSDTRTAWWEGGKWC